MAPTIRRFLEHDGAHVLGRGLHTYVVAPVGQLLLESSMRVLGAILVYSSSTVYSYTYSVSRATSNQDIPSQAP
jgi:hypothetical protein